MAILALKPDKVIMLYSGSKEKLKKIKHLESACLLKIPHLKFEYFYIENINSIEKTVSIFSSIIHKNQNCYLNITGANELLAISAYLASVKNFVPIFKLDPRKNVFINIKGLKSLENKSIAEVLTTDSLFISNGAFILGVQHPIPPANMYENILKFCSFIFKNLEPWKKLCYYLQIGVNHYPQETTKNLFWAPKKINNTKKEAIFSSEYILKKALELNLICNLDICDETVSFCFKDVTFKKYFTDFGSWLEVYCFIKLRESRIFRDVRISVKINWEHNSYDFTNVVNEIDSTFFYKNRPCFLSCKIAEPSATSLQELSMYSTYFGGKYSKVILVTLSKIDKSFSKFYKRAKNMNVLVIDGTDLENNKLIELIETSLKKDEL